MLGPLSVIPSRMGACMHAPRGKGTSWHPAHLQSELFPGVGRFKPDLESLPFPLTLGLRAIKGICAQHLPCGSLLYPPCLPVF